MHVYQMMMVTPTHQHLDEVNKRQHLGYLPILIALTSPLTYPCSSYLVGVSYLMGVPSLMGVTCMKGVSYLMGVSEEFIQHSHSTLFE